MLINCRTNLMWSEPMANKQLSINTTVVMVMKTKNNNNAYFCQI